ncbi:MAG: HAMP domain-containing protein [Boseongicola sp.]|nr:MAG: HAMP domain-containing protein [Boseongicola sp.]
MRVSALFSIYGFVFMATVLAVSSITLWSGQQAQTSAQRIQLAEDSYHRHLALQSNIYQLLKQHGDALIIGDRDDGAMERELRQRIDADIQHIRTVIAKEIELVGEEEFEELALLAELENTINRLTRSLTAATTESGLIDEASRRAWLVDVLDRQIDVELSEMIDDALEEEQEEVRETIEESAAMRLHIRNVIIVTIGAASLVLIWFVFSFRRMVRLPLERLMVAVDAYSDGNFSYQADIKGGAEFAQLGQLLEEMAGGLGKRERSRAEQQQVLEKNVKERTSELQALLQKFETSEDNRRQLMADISHELRTPLAIIQGEAEVSLRETEDQKSQTADSFSRIRDAARHTNRIVQDLLLIARQEAGKLRLDVRETDIVNVIRDALSTFPNSVEFNFDVEDSRATVDSMRMRQCLLAVLHNAKRYGGDEISVALRDEDESLVLSVEDNGTGLSDSEKMQAFNRFFRGSNAAGLSEVSAYGSK